MNFATTEVWGFKHAIRGMRNPKNSWHKSDSYFGIDCDDENVICRIPDGNYFVKLCEDEEYFSFASIGNNDMSLAQTLIRAGSEHRKFMRQIFVSVDITAPLYWWKEFDTYKVGTVANSTSTMHKLASQPITKSCFEVDDYNGVICNNDKFVFEVESSWNELIDTLEQLRQTYLETKDKRVWKELIRLLPDSWLQTRTVTLNYENLFAMCSKGQRRFHKLNERSGIDDASLSNLISWAQTLPYARELIFIDEENEE